MRSLAEIEDELATVARIDERNQRQLALSDRPAVDRVFAVSSAKRRAMLQRELDQAKTNAQDGSRHE